MKKKKLLLIAAIPPFPQDSGGATRIKNTIKQMSNFFNLYLITFKKENYDLKSDEKSDLNKWCLKTIFIPINNHKYFGSYFNTGQPYWFSDWYSPELISIIKSIIKIHHIDLIQIEFSQLLYVIDYLNKNEQNICTFTSHDISTISFFRRLSEVKNIIYKFIHFIRFLEIYFYEKKYISKYQIVNAVTQKDSVILTKFFKPKKVQTVANGIETINFLTKYFRKNHQLALGYIGSFSHPPNRTAILYFIKKIAPLLDKSHIHYRYILAGNNPNFKDSRITNLGIVENVKDFYQKIDILIAPIFSGSGSRIKILEALSFGIPVITTPIGAEGIDIKSNYLQIINTPTEFVQVINNFPIFSENEKENLKSQLKPYLWENIFNQL